MPFCIIFQLLYLGLHSKNELCTLVKCICKGTWTRQNLKPKWDMGKAVWWASGSLDQEWQINTYHILFFFHHFRYCSMTTALFPSLSLSPHRVLAIYCQLIRVGTNDKKCIWHLWFRGSFLRETSGILILIIIELFHPL